MPIVELDCYKDNQLIETITLQGKACFSFGRNQQKVDVCLMHESISREHACIVLDAAKGCLIVDLDSTSGTKVDGETLEPNMSTELKEGAKIEFGSSTRSYLVKLDFRQY